MTISNTSGAISKFRRTAWKFQTTFHTPLQELDSFVSTILADEGGFEKGVVTIQEIVFDTKNLNALMAGEAGGVEISQHYSIEVEGKQKVQQLLRAALSDWIDFLFVPSPKPFVIYADHDEYTTFYANTKSNLNSVVLSLLQKGFKQVPDYQREL